MRRVLSIHCIELIGYKIGRHGSLFCSLQQSESLMEKVFVIKKKNQDKILRAHNNNEWLILVWVMKADWLKEVSQ